MAENLKEVVTEQAARYADLRVGQYVGPRGLGLHVVLLLPSREPVIVGTAQGSITFARGAIVMLGAPAGSRQYVILGLPAPGLGGGAAFAPSVEEGDLDLPQILAVTPSELPIGATTTVYVVGLLLRTEPPFDRWELVTRPAPGAPLVLDSAGRVLSAVGVPDPDSVGLSLEGDQVAVSLSIEIFPEAGPAGRAISLRARR